jgi:hypothetical protein
MLKQTFGFFSGERILEVRPSFWLLDVITIPKSFPFFCISSFDEMDSYQLTNIGKFPAADIDYFFLLRVIRGEAGFIRPFSLQLELNSAHNHDDKTLTAASSRPHRFSSSHITLP